MRAKFINEDISKKDHLFYHWFNIEDWSGSEENFKKAMKALKNNENNNLHDFIENEYKKQGGDEILIWEDMAIEILHDVVNNNSIYAAIVSIPTMDLIEKVRKEKGGRKRFLSK